MLTATKEGTFSASSDPCALFSLAAFGVYPKTRVWGLKPENVHCCSAIGPLKIELRWSCENSSEKTAVGSEVSFKYDPFGRRVEKVSSSTTSIYAYDGDNLVEETNSAGTAVARYSQGLNIDEPLAMLRGSTTDFYEADGLGSVTSLSNSSGANAATYTFDSFGNLTASTGSITNSFRYTAREFDAETSLYYYRARYYDQSVGRFWSEDSLRFRTGVNFYAYVKNAPVILRDPTGHLAWGGGVNLSGMFGLFNGGYGGEVGCYAVGDLKGNSGLLCCGGLGGGLVRGAGVSLQGSSVVCPNCDTICDMEGGFVQVQGFGGAGGGWGGGGGASLGMRTATVFAGAGPGIGGGGGLVVLGGGCKLKLGGSNCKKCPPSK